MVEGLQVYLNVGEARLDRLKAGIDLCRGFGGFAGAFSSLAPASSSAS
jgi:hypothetical protein